MPHDLADLAAEAARLAAATLPIVPVPANSTWLRLMRMRYKDPRGFGLGSSRFSDPRLGLVPSGTPLFGVVYLADDLATAFEEAVLRDRTDGGLPPYAVTRAELGGWHVAPLTIGATLRMVDLRPGSALRSLGLPTDTVRARDHRAGQRASLALHQHVLRPDGIAFPSRFTDRPCLAVYDRALASLSSAGTIPLLDLDIAPILRDLHVAVVSGPGVTTP